jgi:hypothetical protein
VKRPEQYLDAAVPMQLVNATHGGRDSLQGALAFAAVFNQLEVAVISDRLDPEEHVGLLFGTARLQGLVGCC